MSVSSKKPAQKEIGSITLEQKTSLPSTICAELEKDIEKGVFQVGDKLPTEPELMKRFSVSRNSLREAIQALIHAGLLQSRQGSGTYVLAQNRLEVEVGKFFTKHEAEEVEDFKALIIKEICKCICKRASSKKMALQLQNKKAEEGEQQELYALSDLLEMAKSPLLEGLLDVLLRHEGINIKRRNLSPKKYKQALNSIKEGKSKNIIKLFEK